MGPYIARTAVENETPLEHRARWAGIRITCTTCDWWSSDCCSVCSSQDWERHRQRPVIPPGGN